MHLYFAKTAIISNANGCPGFDSSKIGNFPSKKNAKTAYVKLDALRWRPLPLMRTLTVYSSVTAHKQVFAHVAHTKYGISPK